MTLSKEDVYKFNETLRSLPCWDQREPWKKIEKCWRGYLNTDQPRKLIFSLKFQKPHYV